MRDLGDVSYYLGIQVDLNLDKTEIILCQTFYLKKIPEQFHIQDCKPLSTSIEPEIGNNLLPFKEQVDEKTIKWYQLVMELLMRPAIHIQPNLAYSVGVLSQYCNNLRKFYYNFIQRVL